MYLRVLCSSASPGGCDEFIRLLLYRQEVSQDLIKDLRQRLTGLMDHGELISLEVILLKEAWKRTSDAKTLCALYLYDKLKAEGKI